MGLSCIEIAFYTRLLSSKLISGGGDVLEFGESECVGDPMELLERFQHVVAREKLEATRHAIQAAQRSTSGYQRTYGIARAFYDMIFEPASYTSADIAPALRSVWVDLNRPFNLNKRFDYCINNGTSEHVFNQANVFTMIHDHTKVGGLMIHWTPTLGWINHGLYNVQPGFFFDLAGANGYRIEHIEMGAPDAAQPLDSRDAFRQAIMIQPALRESLLCVALRKTTDGPFVMPMQEHYSMAGRAATTFSQVFSEAYVCGWKPQGQPNLALGKTATQSSTSEWSSSDDPTVDARGGNNGILTGSFGFHTDLEDQPWWSVDLAQPESIHEIVIYNRLDARTAIAQHLRISASIDNRIWNDLVKFSAPISFGGADGHPLRLTFGKPVYARYVKVSLLDRNCLHLDEIEIY